MSHTTPRSGWEIRRIVPFFCEGKGGMVVPGALGQNDDIWFEEMVSVVFAEQILPCQLSLRTGLTKAHTSKVSQLVLHAVAFLLCKAEDSNLTDLTIYASMQARPGG